MTTSLCHLFFRLYELMPLRTLEFCCELKKDISSNFILYLCGLNSEKIRLEHLLHYVKAWMNISKNHERYYSSTLPYLIANTQFP